MIPYRSKACSDFSSSEFLFAISHELKNPLSAIIGFSDILRFEMSNLQKSKDSQASLTECLDCINEINQAACEMNELVHDLLDIGSVASGNFSADLSKEIDLKDVIKRSVKINYDYALRRRVALKLNVPDKLPIIKLDEKRMRQILTNLISNAVKYSPENTEIRISVEQVTAGESGACGNSSSTKRNYLKITVSDQGFGMTESQLKTAFTKYHSIQNPNSGKVDSSGLGLPITKQLVELQNGTIEVKSELNKGTEVILQFPCQM